MASTRFASSFARFAKAFACRAGHPAAFVMAVLVVLVWAITGPLFGFSDTWQLVINTGTTIVTFLMVFLIQNTQYRDGDAVQMKLDELIRAVAGAHNALIDLEELDDEQRARLHATFAGLARAARGSERNGSTATGAEDLRR